jgi:acetolactate synthase small subunit
MSKLDDQLLFSFSIEADEKQARRAESLMRKIHGMRTVTVLPEKAAILRMHALFRLRCDISERDGILHFINALDARLLMIRPLWVAFEVVGTPSEVEGIYQSALGYGLVDQVSSSSIFMASGVVTNGNSERFADDNLIAESN